MSPIRRRSFLKSLAATAAASTLPHHLHALAQAPLASTYTAPPILLNQLGYLPNHAKIATILLAKLPTQTPPTTFRVLSQNHSSVFEGKLSAPTLDAASGDTTAQADFSSITKPGLYQLEIAGITSDPFTISPTVYADALRLTMRGFYGQRCGCNVDLGNGYKHPACHHDGAFDPTSGRSGSIPNAGGWHDAGDYGRYIVNSSTGTLLWAWELYPDALHSLSLNIPESGHTLPDFLAEIRWNLNWMLSLQDPTDGGVWHKQTSLHFCAFIMPQDDHLPSEIIGTGLAPYKSTCATADFAAVMAIAARCYQPFDPAFAARCLTAARSAWTWASNHPNIPFNNPPTVSTGDYGDNDCSDELLWASAELFRTTHNPQYEAAFLDSIKPLLPNLKITVPSWNNVASLGLWTYALATTTPGAPSSATVPSSPKVGSHHLSSAIQQATQTAAAELIARTQTSGYGTTPLARRLPLGLQLQRRQPVPAPTHRQSLPPQPGHPQRGPLQPALPPRPQLLRRLLGHATRPPPLPAPSPSPQRSRRHRRTLARPSIRRPQRIRRRRGSRRPPQSSTHAHVARRPACLLDERDRHQLERPTRLSSGSGEQQASIVFCFCFGFGFGFGFSSCHPVGICFFFCFCFCFLLLPLLLPLLLLLLLPLPLPLPF